MLKGKFSSRRRVTEEVDAMSGLANLSDVMLVFACGLMAAVILNWNVDLSKTRVEILQREQMQELERWDSYRRALPRMEELRALLSQRIAEDYALTQLTAGEQAETAEKMQAAARLAADKAAQWMLAGMQNQLDERALEACREAILRKAPQLRDRSMI